MKKLERAKQLLEFIEDRISRQDEQINNTLRYHDRPNATPEEIEQHTARIEYLEGLREEQLVEREMYQDLVKLYERSI